MLSSIIEKAILRLKPDERERGSCRFLPPSLDKTMTSAIPVINLTALSIVIITGYFVHVQREMLLTRLSTYHPDSPDIRKHPFNVLVHDAKPRDARGILYSSDTEISPRALRVKKGLDEIASNWEAILAEYRGYERDHKVLPAWEFSWHKTIWVKFFNLEVGSESYFPLTLKLLNKAGVVSGYFAKVLPNSSFHPHIGYIAGIWRYHLTLKAPKLSSSSDVGFGQPKVISEDENILSPLHLGVQRSPDLEALDGKQHYVDGLYLNNFSKYECKNHGMTDSKRRMASVKLRNKLKKGWMYHEYTDGNFLLFDDNNIHYVQNATPHERLILLLDIPRDDLPWYIDIVNRLALCIFGKYIPEIIESGRGILSHYKLTAEGKGGDVTTIELLAGMQVDDSGGYEFSNNNPNSLV